MREKKRIGLFDPSLGFQEKIKWSAGSRTPDPELGAGNALAPHCKETGFSSPAFTPRPSFCSTPHCFVFSPLALVRRGPAQPCIKKPQIAVVLGYWSQK